MPAESFLVANTIRGDWLVASSQTHKKAEPLKRRWFLRSVLMVAANKFSVSHMATKLVAINLCHLKWLFFANFHHKKRKEHLPATSCFGAENNILPTPKKSHTNSLEKSAILHHTSPTSKARNQRTAKRWMQTCQTSHQRSDTLRWLGSVAPDLPCKKTWGMPGFRKQKTASCCWFSGTWYVYIYIHI